MDKVRFCESFGTEVVDHQTVDVVEGVRALTDSQGVDVVLDPVQGVVASRIRAVLRPYGRYRPTVICCVPFDKVPDVLTDLAAAAHDGAGCGRRARLALRQSISRRRAR